MKYLKYRHKFAWGTDEWCYKYDRDYTGISNEEMEDILEGMSQSYAYSDKYRGIDYEFIDELPVNTLKKRLKEMNETLKYWLSIPDRIETLRERIAQVEKEIAERK